MPIDVLLDATPVARGHATRGIGLATHHLIDALRTTLPFDMRPTLLVERNQDLADGFAGTRIRLPRWPTGRIPDPWPALRLPDLLRATRPRLFHATQPQLTPDAHEFRTVATCYDLTPLHENIRNPLHRTAYSTYLQRLTRARLVIAISHATAADLTTQLGIPPERIRVVQLGLPPAPPAEGPTPGAPYALFANSIEPHKNPQVAIDAIAATRGLRLVMTGTWSRRRLERLRGHATRRGVADRIDWLGFVPAARLAALRRDAVAVLVPSRREGFGFPVLEALASRTPVLAADIPALVEVGGNHATYLDPSDPSAWGRALQELAEAPPTGDRRDAGQVWAQTFTWERTADQTVAVWREALADG